MRTVRRVLAIALLASVAALALILALSLPVPELQISPALASRQPDAGKGRYIAVLGDCAGCHTVADGKELAGGMAFPTPLGTLYSTNITPDRDSGIGKYSFADFVRVMRLGITPDGTRLYPAMPYTAYAKISDEDLQDLFAWLQTDVAAANQHPPANSIPWPLSIRWPLAVWNKAFHDSTGFAADPTQSDSWNRGAYLVLGLAHCGTCHTPRGLAFQERDVRGTTDLFLSGARFNGTSPINLRVKSGEGIATWTASDIALLLKSGHTAVSGVSGPMAEVVDHSTQFMTDDDLAAIAAYLKSLAPAPEAGPPRFAASDVTMRKFMSGEEPSPGGRLYMDSCAACHRLSGAGERFAFPALAGNPMVLNADPASLIAVILDGAHLPSTALAPSGLAMPGFGWRYDDAEIAALASFVRSGWGNNAAPVTAAQVAELRRKATGQSGR